MASAEVALTTVEQFRRFWRWWTGELRACVPAFLSRAVNRMRVLPLVVPEPIGFTLYRFDGATWQRVAKTTGETPEASASALGAMLRKAGVKRFSLALNPGQYLSKIIHLPQAAEDNLRNALRYELDRHTPFKPEDVSFDCCVVGRNNAAREIDVRMVIAPKTTISHAVESVAASGVLVAAVQPALPDAASLPINLLPHEENGSSPMQRIVRWAPWMLLAGLAGVALVLPIHQKRAQVIELQPQVNIAAQQAQAADALHQQLDRAQGEYNFLLQKRYSTPTSLQLLHEVTRILPDDTWLQNFELRSTSKGRELQLQGETGVAGKMIELFEQSALLTGATFKSPMTQAPGSQGSRFHLGMEVKEAAPPSPQVLVAASASESGAPPASTASTPATPAPTQDAAPPAATAKAPAPAVPAPATPAQATPAQATPAQATPAQATPAQITPAQITPAPAASAQPASPSASAASVSGAMSPAAANAVNVESGGINYSPSGMPMPAQAAPPAGKK